MRKNIVTAAMILAACTAGAQQTLTIIDQDYELAKQTAVQQRKLLIVDFYTTWCQPCKTLDKTIFKNDSIAGEISKNFVVLKYDAERDSVHNLSLKHHVGLYPTNIVLTADGKLIHKMLGTGASSSLVESYTRMLKESIGLNKQGKYIEGYAATIDPGLYPEFYKKYVRRTADIKPGDLDNYWANHKNLKSEVSFDILSYFGKAPDWAVDTITRNKKEYEQRFGKDDVKFVISGIASGKFRKAVAKRDEKQYESAIQFVKQQLPADEAKQYQETYSLEMLKAMGKWDKAISVIEEQASRKAIDENGINYFCWDVYEKCEEQNVIGRAVFLMKSATDSQPSFAALDTYARLLLKNGKKEQAKVEMKRAIEKGKANGEDTRESEEALAKF